MREFERERGRDMKDVERARSEERSVASTELAGRIERSAPKRVEKRQSPFTKIAVEVVRRSDGDFWFNDPTLDGEKDRIHDFRATEARDRQRAPGPLPPRTESPGPIVVKVQTAKGAGVDVGSFSARHDLPRRACGALLPKAASAFVAVAGHSNRQSSDAPSVLRRTCAT